MLRNQEKNNSADSPKPDIVKELNKLKDSLHEEVKSIDTIELWNSDKKTDILEKSAHELNNLTSNILRGKEHNSVKIHTTKNENDKEIFFQTLDIWEHASIFKKHFPVSYATFEKLLIGKNVTQDIQAFAMGTLESVETIVKFVKDILFDIARLLLNLREEILNSK